MTWIAATQYPRTPPRRKRGGLAARGLAAAVACALGPVPAAFGAAEPAPDPVPQQVQPDPAPVKTSPPPAKQQPVTRQPVVQAPTRTVATTPAATTPRHAAVSTETRPPAKAHKPHKTKAHKSKRAKPAAKRDATAPAHQATPPAAVEHPAAAITAVRRLAQVLEFAAPAKTADRSALPLAAAALLLLVVAGVSVLRLGTRMSSELYGGRSR